MDLPVPLVTSNFGFCYDSAVCWLLLYARESDVVLRAVLRKQNQTISLGGVRGPSLWQLSLPT